MQYTVPYTKSLPAPSIKKLLREAGWNLSTVAARRGVAPSIVSRVVRKQLQSGPVWEDVVWCLNNPRQEDAA